MFHGRRLYLVITSFIQFCPLTMMHYVQDRDEKLSLVRPKDQSGILLLMILTPLPSFMLSSSSSFSALPVHLQAEADSRLTSSALDLLTIESPALDSGQNSASTSPSITATSQNGSTNGTTNGTSATNGTTPGSSDSSVTKTPRECLEHILVS